MVRDLPEKGTAVVRYKVRPESVLEKGKKRALTFQESQIVANLYDQNDLNIPRSNKFSNLLIFRRVIRHPPELDSLKLNLIAESMRKSLTNNGFLNGRVHYQVRFKKYKKTTLARVVFYVQLAEPFFINKIYYNMGNAHLAQLVQKNMPVLSYLQTNQLFNTANINAEIQQIVSLARDSGYLKIEGKAFDFTLDTSWVAQNNVQKKAEKEKKLVDVYLYTIHTEEEDSIGYFKRYLLHHLSFYPNYRPQDTAVRMQSYKRIYVGQSKRFVYPLVIDKLNALAPDALFSQNDYNHTIRTFLQTNIWSIVNFSPKYLSDTLIGGKRFGRLNLTAQMFRASKFNTNAELGLSYNITPRNVLFTLPNQTLATNAKFSFTIRNILKTALETQIIANAGVDGRVLLSPFSYQPLLSEYSVSVLNHLPWLFPFDFYKRNKNTLKRTYLNVSGRYIDRLNFYQLMSASFSYAWVIDNQKRQLNISLLPFQMSLNRLGKKPLFLEEEKRTPSLANAFNQGFIAGVALSFAKIFDYKKAPGHNTHIKLNIEESGLTWGQALRLNSTDLFQYIRAEFTFTHYYKLFKSGFAYRMVAGVGFAFGEDVTLPFYKQFFVGGPNSMRGWTATRLGLGSSPLINELTFKDRYGDIHWETNLEYRFRLLSWNALFFEGVLFTDAGNIWSRRLLSKEYPGSVFSFKNLPEDIAIAVGTGLRIGLSFFIFRVDLGLRLKDPVYQGKAQWLHPDNLKWRNMQIQIGLGYPF